VKLKGVFRKGKNLHDYKVPNNPDNQEWHNLALEDIGIYWELPNFDECKHYYFEVVDIGDGNASTENHKQLFPVPMTTDEVIEDHYGWYLNQSTNKNLYRSFGAIAAVSAGIIALA
jgi:hypothetical protein